MVHDSIPPRLKYAWSLVAGNGKVMAVGVQLYILKRTARQAAQRALKRMP